MKYLVIFILFLVYNVEGAAQGRREGTTLDTNCPKNEEYTDCVLAHCAPETCQDVGRPVICTEVIPPCDGGCVCKYGFVRDAKEVCVPERNCQE